MRLTDADKQLEWVDCMTPIHDIGLEPVVTIETVRDLIKGAPTIDAIPVEWLNEFDKYYGEGIINVKTILTAWRKNQEAR